MKILITGACGFVGHALTLLLREARPHWEILGFDNLSRSGSELNRSALVQRGVKVVHGDLRVAADLEELGRADWVIDAAANPSVLAGHDGKASSRQLLQHNLLGTINLLEYCKLHRAGLVILSTSRVYSAAQLAHVELEANGIAFRPKLTGEIPAGLSKSGVAEDFSTEPPLSLYGVSKRASELIALEYAFNYGVRVWINRCGVMAGAGQFGKADQGIFSYWINAYASGRPLTYIGFGGSGQQVRDCLHPRDLFSLVLQQIEGAEAGKPRLVNVAGGVENSLSLAQLTAWCAARFGKRDILREASNRPNDVPWLVLDSRLAAAEWDWRPQVGVGDVLEEIARHAEAHPNWLELSEH